MNAPEDHSQCRERLAAQALENGTEVDVSAVKSHHPLAESFVCPHRIRYWLLPTAEQFARWEAALGVVVGDVERDRGKP